MELLQAKKIMCCYYEICMFPSDNCTEENARESCELFEDLEKQSTEKKEA